MDTITRLDPADTIARSQGHCDRHYSTPVVDLADGDLLALGHGRRALAALVAHARACGGDPRTYTGRRRWATFRLPTPEDAGDYDWYLDWDDDEYPTGTPVTMLTPEAGAR